MRKTIAGQFHLRAIKCPGCAARLPYVSGAATVTCEYCQLVSEVVGPKRKRAQQPGQGSPAATPQDAPQVTPTIRPAALALTFSFLVVIAVVIVVIGATAFQTRAQSAVAMVQARAQAMVQAHVKAEARAFAARTATAHKKSSVATKPTRVSAKRSPKKHRARKPNVYELARIIKPAIKGCYPRDIGGNHPVYYSPTMTFTVAGGRFKENQRNRQHQQV